MFLVLGSAVFVGATFEGRAEISLSLEKSGWRSVFELPALWPSFPSLPFLGSLL
jgi:hypothetical protein